MLKIWEDFSEIFENLWTQYHYRDKRELKVSKKAFNKLRQEHRQNCVVNSYIFFTASYC